ncbi:MAG: hypothetical protein K6E63_00570 [Lachnospiraceae bacterium]|nr:hypothetical protein [Lachnospiraceae bacterium]
MIKRVGRKRFIECTVKLIIILAVFVSAYFVLDRIMLIKSEDGIVQMQAYYRQPEGSVDALFVGSSHIFCHINTGVLWDEYGISGFDLAGAEQPFWNSYYYIREALKSQRPKVIVLDITTPGIRPIDYQPENWFITNTYGIKRNSNRYGAIKASALSQSFARLLIPLNSTHGRCVELTEEDFLNYDDSVYYKGFDPRETTVVFERPDISGVTERAPLSDKETEYLKMIIEYVQQEGVPLLFLSSPYIVTKEEQEKYNTIFDIADEYGVPYIDGNKLYDEMGLDFENDFAEVLHLNRSGNEKLSSFIGRYLKDNYGLLDHRGDAKYGSWDVDAYRQRQDTHDYYLSQAVKNKDSKEYLRLLNEPAYVVFCCVESGYEGLVDDTVVAELEALGLKREMLTSHGAFILNKGQCIFSSYDYDFKAGINDGNRRILFYRTYDNDNDHAFTYVLDNGSFTHQSMTGYEKYMMEGEGISFYVFDTVHDKALGGYSIK